MMRVGWSALCAAALSGCVSTQASRINSYLTKPGITPEQYTADEQYCIDTAKKDLDAARAKLNASQPYQPGLAGAAATGFATGWARGELIAEAHKQTRKCMDDKGYRIAMMTPEQIKIYQSLDDGKRRQFSAVLAAGSDISPFKPEQ